MLLDGLAIGLLGYAGALAFAAQRPPVGRRTLIAFTIADAAWVAGSAVVLWLFWAELAPVARLLVIAVAIAVEVPRDAAVQGGGHGQRSFTAAGIAARR